MQKHRTLAYYDYLWNRHRTFDPACTRFTADLSPTLRKEILLHMNRDVVLNCDFFRDVSNECILRLVHNFKYAVFLAHDILAEEGHVAEELVFLIHGSATVQKIGRVMPVSLLSPGDYFGEKSLLTNALRDSDCIAKSAVVECLVLSRSSFDAALGSLTSILEQDAQQFSTMSKGTVFFLAFLYS